LHQPPLLRAPTNGGLEAMLNNTLLILLSVHAFRLAERCLVAGSPRSEVEIGSTLIPDPPVRVYLSWVRGLFKGVLLTVEHPARQAPTVLYDGIVGP
jgi:hypothetical protein